jgi:hypothetical protein
MTSLPDSYSDHWVIACTKCDLMNDNADEEQWNRRQAQEAPKAVCKSCDFYEGCEHEFLHTDKPSYPIAPKAESQSAEDDFGPVNLNDEEPDKLKAASRSAGRTAQVWESYQRVRAVHAQWASEGDADWDANILAAYIDYLEPAFAAQRQIGREERQHEVDIAELEADRVKIEWEHDLERYAELAEVLKEARYVIGRVAMKEPVAVQLTMDHIDNALEALDEGRKG